MPRFRFVAVDSTGELQDGAINAASETDARTKLASNGLAVRTVEEVAVVPGDPPPVEVPRPRAPAKAVPGPPPAQKRDPEPPVAPRRGSVLPLIFSLLALVVALATAGYVAFGSRSASRLSRYDFSTPAAAYKSMIQIQTTGDPELAAEYNRRFYGKLQRERRESIDVVKTVDFLGKQVLFVTSTQNGQPVREVVFMERDPEANGWKRSFIPFEQVRQTNPQLFDEIQKWPAMPRPDW